MLLIYFYKKNINFIIVWRYECPNFMKQLYKVMGWISENTFIGEKQAFFFNLFRDLINQMISHYCLWFDAIWKPVVAIGEKTPNSNLEGMNRSEYWGSLIESGFICLEMEKLDSIDYFHLHLTRFVLLKMWHWVLSS